LQYVLDIAYRAANSLTLFLNFVPK